MAFVDEIQGNVREAARTLCDLGRKLPDEAKRKLAEVVVTLDRLGDDMDSLVDESEAESARWKALEATEENAKLRAVIQTCPGCRHFDPATPLGCSQAGRSWCGSRSTLRAVRTA